MGCRRGSRRWAVTNFTDRAGGSGTTFNLLLAHCKYSSKSEGGARIDDLYDVCGQAMKMNRAKSVPELLARRLL